MEKYKNILKIALISGFLLYACPFPYANAGGMSKSDVISLVNKSRTKEGVPALRENDILSIAAKAKADDMLKNNYFAHTSPDGKDPWYWLKKIGYKYKTAGENLAINYDTASEQHSAWMKSATHKKNIMNRSYEETGVAIARGEIDGEEVLVAVQLFGSPAIVATAKKESAQMESVPVVQEKIPEVLSAEKVALENIQTEPALQKKEEIFKIEEVQKWEGSSAEKYLEITTFIFQSILGAIFIINTSIVFSRSLVETRRLVKQQEKIEVFPQ